MSRFSDEQIRRYSRQILLREVGGVGQTRLGAARPGLFCASEVGQVAADYLWRAGVTDLVLFAADVGAATRLTKQLTATGYPGAAAQSVSAAAETVQSLVLAAPGFTLLWLPDATLLWARCDGTWGGIGQGHMALHDTAAAHSGAAIGARESGPAAMIIGSALALLAMQKILGTAPAATAAADAIWQIDLNRPEPPAWG